jgi:hypothetical protein
MRHRLVLPLAVAALVTSGCASLGSGGAAPRPSAEHVALAERALRASPLIDGHNDLPWAIRQSTTAPHDVEAYDLRLRTPGHTDLDRLHAGLLGGQFWSVYVPGDTATARLGFAKVQLEQIDIALRVIAKYPDAFEPVTTATGIPRRVRARPHRLGAGHGGGARDRELAGRAACLLRAGRALHDAHAQPAPRLGRRRLGGAAAGRAESRSARRSCGR